MGILIELIGPIFSNSSLTSASTAWDEILPIYLYQNLHSFLQSIAFIAIIATVIIIILRTISRSSISSMSWMWMMMAARTAATRRLASLFAIRGWWVLTFRGSHSTVFQWNLNWNESFQSRRENGYFHNLPRLYEHASFTKNVQISIMVASILVELSGRPTLLNHTLIASRQRFVLL